VRRNSTKVRVIYTLQNGRAVTFSIVCDEPLWAESAHSNMTMVDRG